MERALIVLFSDHGDQVMELCTYDDMVLDLGRLYMRPVELDHLEWSLLNRDLCC